MTAAPTQFSIDPGAEPHAPELYRSSRRASSVTRFEDITDEHLNFYRDMGYLVVEQALTPAEVDAGLRGLTDLALGANPTMPPGLVSYEGAVKDRLATLSPQERLDAMRKLFQFHGYDARLDGLMSHPKIIDLISRLMDDEPRLFQSMALVKPPQLGREKPWHQDCAYFDFPFGTRVVGVWIALDPATIANGCMHLLPGLHKQGPQLHYHRRDWQICDSTAMALGAGECTAVPLAPGGALFFDGFLPHGTPTNHSSDRRRALQFHYHPAKAVKMSTEDRRKLFGGDLNGVTC